MATVVITGANRGIGLALTEQLSRRGDTVIAICRSASPELKALDVRVVEGVDVSDGDSVKTLTETLSGVKIDVLINNAGILRGSTLDDLNVDDMIAQYVVNSVGPLLVTQALRGNLSSGGKVAIVTSRMGSMTDNSSGGHYGYRMSKAAVNMAGVSLAQDLKPEGVAVVLLHPGWVKTDMTSHNGLIEVDESAEGMIKHIDALSLENTGTFWHTNGERLSW